MAISLKRKEAIRQQHPLYGQQPIEVHHQQPRFLDGTDDDENFYIVRPTMFIGGPNKSRRGGK